MSSAKDIRVEPISSKDANRIMRSLHYSGKVVRNSQVHFGVFLGGRCGGALQFGPSLDKRKIIGLVEGTGWREFLELNRMALADWLPRNGESRSIAVAMRLLKKAYPWLKWIISYADATQCGDGTIYRASGFVLTAIKKNAALYRMPGGEVMHEMAIKTGRQAKEFYKRSGGRASVRKTMEALGAQPLEGFQLRYIYFLDPESRKRLTVPELPYSAIAEAGAGMYRGNASAGSIDGDAPAPPGGRRRFNSDPGAPPIPAGVSDAQG